MAPLFFAAEEMAGLKDLRARSPEWHVRPLHRQIRPGWMIAEMA